MKHNHEIEDELREIAPFLADLRKEGDGFEVPQDYFSKLSDEMLAKVKPQSIPSQPGWIDQLAGLLQTLLMPQVALRLAIVTGVIVIAVVLFTRQTEDHLYATTNDLSTEEIQKYILHNIDEFDIELITNVIEDPVILREFSTDALEGEELDKVLEEMIDEIDIQELEELL